MDGDAPPPAEITRILREWQDGSREALERLMPVVYNELRMIASRAEFGAVSIRGTYRGEGATAMPQGRSPTLTLPSIVNVSTSTTEMSFEGPFAL